MRPAADADGRLTPTAREMALDAEVSEAAVYTAKGHHGSIIVNLRMTAAIDGPLAVVDARPPYSIRQLDGVKRTS